MVKRARETTFGDLLRECRAAEESSVNEAATTYECSRCGKEFDVFGEEAATCPQCGHLEEPPTEAAPVPRKSETKVNEKQLHCPRCDAPQNEMHSIDDMDQKWKCDNCGTVFTREEGEATTDELGEAKINELEYDDPDTKKSPEKARTRKDLLKKKRKKPSAEPEPEEEAPPEEIPGKEAPLAPREEEAPAKSSKPKTPEAPDDSLPEKPGDDELDSDKIPPAPDEVQPDASPIEARKEYVGRSEDVHFYFLTVEGDGGAIEDFVITDQEGIKKYSAKEKEIPVSEEGIGAFLIKVYRDVEINQIERSIYMKYVYPELLKLAPEEEEMFGGEEEEGIKKEGEQQEDEVPEFAKKESKKLNASVDKEDILAAVKDAIRMHARSGFQHSGELDSDTEKKVLKWYEEGADLNHILMALGIPVEVDPITLDWPWLKKANEKCKKSRPPKKVKENSLIELRIIDDEENSFDVHLIDDDTDDTVMTIGEREFRFSPEFTSMWKDEVSGVLSEEGVKEIALLKLADLEETEYNELLGKTAEAEDAVQDTDIENENENIKGDSDMKLSDFTDAQLKEELATREGINPKKEDSEEKKVEKLAEEAKVEEEIVAAGVTKEKEVEVKEEAKEVKEEKLEETDVAKGAKALITLAKDALKAGNYTEAAEHCAKLAEIEAVIPAEAEAEAEKGDKADPKDDSKKDPPKKDLPKEEPMLDPEPEPELEAKEEAKEEPVAEVVDEVKDKEKAAKKAKKEKEEKEKAAKKAKAEKEAKAKKKESKIKVEEKQTLDETKGIGRLKDLLNMEPIT